MKKITRKRTLQSRFFKSYFLLTMAIVIIFAAFFYYYTSAILIDRETENIISLTTYMQNQTDQELGKLDDLSINVGYINMIMPILDEYFQIETHEPTHINQLADIFVAINGANTQADQINVYDFSGRVVGFGYRNIYEEVDLKAQSWYQPALSLQGHKYISAPYSTDSLSRMAKSNIYYISLYRLYYNRLGRQSGIIEVMQRCNTIFKPILSLKNSDPESPDIFVYNEKGTLVFPFKYDDQMNLINPDGYLDLIDLSTNHTTANHPVSGQKEVLAYQQSEYSGWTYITVLPEKVILAPARQLTLLLSLVFVFLLILTVFLSYSVSRKLAKPIKHLQRIIHKTELDTLHHQTNTPLDNSFDEIENLNQAFFNMSEKLRKSMDQIILAKHQEIRARTLALQSQINPHFYYNSLSSIIILAENQQCEDVVNLSRNLKDIMRYISKSHSPVVSIREEVDYLRKYMYCMKVRYQTSLNYDISISADLLEEKIPSLLIQPIVENSLKYGNECYPPWHISVLGRRISNQYEYFIDDEKTAAGYHAHGWIIEVTDSGPGFSDEALADFQRIRSEVDTTEGLPSFEIEKLGLANAYARWKLYAGDACVFICDNVKNGGARVTIGKIIYRNEQNTS